MNYLDVCTGMSAATAAGKRVPCLSQEEYCILMLHVYADESMDEKQSKICVVAGVVGTEEAWLDLQAKWEARTGGLPFHAKDCDSDFGDYRPKGNEDHSVKHRQNKSLYQDMVALLASSQIGGYASAYDLVAQRRVFSPFEPPVYFQPFIDVLRNMADFANRNDDVAELIFDNRPSIQHNAALIYAHYRENVPDCGERLASKLSFESSAKNSRIQVADLFAREARKQAENDLAGSLPMRTSWEVLADTKRFWVEISDEEFSKQTEEKA